MKKRMILGATLLALGLAGPAQATDEPENVIKYRQSVMKSMGGHIGAIAGYVKGEVSFKDHVPTHAQALADTAKLVSAALFPKGTSNEDFENTRALPKIWAEPDKLKAAAAALGEESAKLASVAASGDDGALGAQLQALGKACGGCHKPFRAEKE